MTKDDEVVDNPQVALASKPIINSAKAMTKLIKTNGIYTNSKLVNIEPKEKYQTAFVILTIIAFILAMAIAGTSDFQTIIAR